MDSPIPRNMPFSGLYTFLLVTFDDIDVGSSQALCVSLVVSDDTALAIPFGDCGIGLITSPFIMPLLGLLVFLIAVAPPHQAK